ncbi:ankyrin repeat domain-containing protein [Psychromonas aquimarina]|uniref:ankyrin repeat domain-containing protein n=1 Tax=Psychromonas aquimarina TaxID=444919 RepID=UPI00040C5AAC|nr:ankyrin repeat domain-containing protein [Psychromonas aquimarina]
MSESYLVSEIYIADPITRQHFIDKIPIKLEPFLIEGEEVSVQDIYVDEVISLNLMGSRYSSLDTLYRKWLKKHHVDIAIINFTNDEGGTTFGFHGGKKVSFKKALNLMSDISRRVETGITFQMPEKKIMKYLKANDVNPVEIFQGWKHIDRLICNGDLKAIEYFIDKGLAGNYIVTDISYSIPRQSYLLHRISYKEGYPLIKKLIKMGTNPNLLDELGNNLLHGIHSIEFTKFLIDSGVDVNQVNKSRQTPMLYLADYFGKYCSSEEVEDFLSVMDLLINANAVPDVVDENGAGVLLHCRNFPSIREWFFERFPNLEEHDLSKDKEAIIIKLIPSMPENIEFWEQCLDEKVYTPLYNDILKGILIDTPYERTTSNINCHALLKATMLIKLACKRDDLNIIHALEKFGFPLLMPSDYSTNSYELAIKNKSSNILKYMNSKGVNESLINELKISIATWIEHISEVLNSGQHFDLSNFCSKRWLESNEEQWKKLKPDDRATTLQEYFLEVIQKRDLNTSPLRAKNSCFNQMQNIWGNQLFITQSENGVAYSDGAYKFISKEELYEALNLNFEVGMFK